ncbi:MAG: ATP-binding protein [Deinococcota bacterium]
MSKLNQIQQALLEMSGGEFQKLVDALLAEKGFGYINSIGSVVAANKVRKGTPDTLISTPRGTYIFAEHTTEQNKLLNKLKDDLSKCFDESKIGIPLDKVERIVFCFTGRLNASEQTELADSCQDRGINLDLFGIDAIALDLYNKYPALARDFLGVSVDTGQIVSLKYFVSLYNKNKLATRLDLGFHFREDELHRLLDALEDNILIFLSGKAGIGKSRLALEACEHFHKKHPEYKVLCVFGRHRDLWEDLRTWFTRPGNFLILVDDANRISKFEYVVDLLQNQREDQSIKVVATVRDYALAQVKETTQSLGEWSEIFLTPFSDEQIKKLITDEYGIVNSHYLARIADIAQGNSRLAVMAAEVAKEKPLSSIYDISNLYDNYFSSIQKDLSNEGTDLGSAYLLQVAAIVSFFKAVDQTNEVLMSDIMKVFDIPQDTFWEAAERLHKIEMLDMYENEVVRVSDQVLGTYLFYLAVFKKQVVDFGVLIVHFFPKLQHKLVDSINPILNAFDSKKIALMMHPHVEQAKAALEEVGDKKGLLHLFDVFWFTDQTSTLLWVRDQINELQPERLEIDDITFAKNANALPSPSILGILSRFAFVNKDKTQIALDLLLRYLIKRPKETPHLLRVLTDQYGFRTESYLRQFEIQHAVVDALWNHAKDGNLLFSWVFLAIAKNYLGTHFENHEMKDNRTLQILSFELPVTEDLITLREAIWKRLFNLYNQKKLQDEILRIIRHYIVSPKVMSSKIIRSDAKHVLPFLQSVLTPSNYLHCVVMNDYLGLLEEHEREIPDGLRDQFKSDIYRLTEILLPNYGERRELHMSYENYRQHKQERIKEYTENYKLADYIHFFNQCLEIREIHNHRNDEYQIQGGVIDAFLLLADRDPNLYSQVLEHYVELGNPLQLNSTILVQKLMEKHDYKAVPEVLKNPQDTMKKKWLFGIYAASSAEDINKDLLVNLYDLYETAEKIDLPNPHDFDYLLKYLSVDKQVVAKVVAKILEKVEGDPHVAYALIMLFNPYTDVAKRLPELFFEDFDLLKRAYLVVENTQHNDDHEGQVFNQLLDIDPAFITDYIAWKYKSTEHGWLSSHNDHRDYSFIWLRPDHHDIMDRIVESIYEHEQDNFTYIDPFIETFFQIRGNHNEEKNIQEKQDTYLLSIIDKQNQDAEFMQYIFGLVARLSPERRYKFIERFVRWNDNIEDFKHLKLEPQSWSFSGSWVPTLNKRKQFWESLLPIMNSVDLLSHKQYIELHIHSLQAQIEEEKKKDFIGE